MFSYKKSRALLQLIMKAIPFFCLTEIPENIERSLEYLCPAVFCEILIRTLSSKMNTRLSL